MATLAVGLGTLGACGGGGDDAGDSTADGLPGFDRELACFKMGSGDAGSQCTAAKNVNDDAYDQEMMACPQTGGTFSDTCPTANLFGCCHYPTGSGGYETISCVYTDDSPADNASAQATCEASGGMTYWDHNP